MGRSGKLAMAELKNLQKQLNKLGGADLQIFVDSCAKSVAAQLLSKVTKRTPIGNYSKEVLVVAKRDSKKHKKGDTYTKRVNPSGKKGGTLRRGWTAKTHEEAANGSGSPKKNEIEAFADTLKVNRAGKSLTVEIINPVEYSTYVEKGHRKSNHKGWVPGRFMLATAEREVQSAAPKALEKKINRFLEERLK